MEYSDCPKYLQYLDISKHGFPTIYSVDFDGTLFKEDKYPAFGKPIEPVITFLKERREHGCFIILFTMREGAALDSAVKACAEYGLEFDAVNDNLPHIIDLFGTNPRKIFSNYHIEADQIPYDDILWLGEHVDADS